jgi:NAD(P)-dependent dehydrogenase (short-subunit alcohol dehydrogenase family)
VLVIRADAGDVAGQPAVAEAVGRAFGGLDIRFVNAGVGDHRPVEKWDEAGFDRSIAITLKGLFFLIQALLPILANPASIVLNTSIQNRIGLLNCSVYAATKAALRSLARTLSAELISRGVRVNPVSPGPITTPLLGKRGLREADLEARVAFLQSQIPAGRWGNPSEIAQAVVFLGSDEATFTVGSEFVIDGGMSNL